MILYVHIITGYKFKFNYKFVSYSIVIFGNVKFQNIKIMKNILMILNILINVMLNKVLKLM